MENNKFNFSSIKKESFAVNNGYDRDTNPYREDHVDCPKYMKFGADNQYPEYLISLYNQSSIHASCINSIVQAITGDGLVTENEEILKRANGEGESWNDIFRKVALDYKLFGGYALEIKAKLPKSITLTLVTFVLWKKMIETKYQGFTFQMNGNQFGIITSNKMIKNYLNYLFSI